MVVIGLWASEQCVDDIIQHNNKSKAEIVFLFHCVITFQMLSSTDPMLPALAPLVTASPSIPSFYSSSTMPRLRQRPDQAPGKQLHTWQSDRNVASKARGCNLYVLLKTNIHFSLNSQVQSWSPWASGLRES